MENQRFVGDLFDSMLLQICMQVALVMQLNEVLLYNGVFVLEATGRMRATSSL